MLLRIVLCSLLLACQPSYQAGPVVAVTTYGPTWSGEEMLSLRDAVSSWGPLGIWYVEDPYEVDFPNPCLKDWYLHPPDCRIYVGIEKTTGLIAMTGAAGLTNRDNVPYQIQVDASLDVNSLREVCTHEFGHVVLNTGWHLPAGVRGIMSPAISSDVQTPPDWGLACASTGICVYP